MQNKELKLIVLVLFLVGVAWSGILLNNMTDITWKELNNSLFTIVFASTLVIASIGILMALFQKEGKEATIQIDTNEQLLSNINLDKETQEEEVATQRLGFDIEPLRAELATIDFSSEENKEKVLRKICTYFELGIGILYERSRENDLHAAVATYACLMPDAEHKYVFSGEGLTGQVVKEKNPILIRNIPGDYHKVVSGLGELSPSAICIIPVIEDGSVELVFELASLTDLSEEKWKILIEFCQEFKVTVNS